MAPKITGMLIDLETFKVSDVLEFLKDENLLEAEVEKAFKLIEDKKAADLAS